MVMLSPPEQCRPTDTGAAMFLDDISTVHPAIQHTANAAVAAIPLASYLAEAPDFAQFGGFVFAMIYYGLLIAKEVRHWRNEKKSKDNYPTRDYYDGAD